MKINIKEINKSPDKQLEITFLDYIEELESKDKISAVLTASASEAGINIKGIIKADIITQCDRCLENYVNNVNININEDFVNKEIVPNGQKDYELSMNELIEELNNNGELDIKDLIYQSIVLELPQKNLCSSDCPGSEEFQELQATNANNYIDERLEVFKTFSENNFS